MAPDRIRLTVRYDGTEFAGSQIQPRKRTVSGTLKAGLEAILGGTVHLVWASRTDAGVHAEGNVCAFDAELGVPVERIPLMLRPVLPPDLEVREAACVAREFHPRFDALRRTYRYRLYRGADVPYDRQRYTAPVSGPWDAAVVAEARRLVAGARPFDWCAATQERSGGVVYHRRPEQCLCALEPIGEETMGPEIVWTFRADRFLRHMVCRLAGLLIEVAHGKRRVEQIAALMQGTASFQFKPAPAKGLALWSIEYAPPPRV